MKDSGEHGVPDEGFPGYGYVFGDYFPDPFELLARKEHEELLWTILELSGVSKSDWGFLVSYFNFGPGGSGIVDNQEFAMIYGLENKSLVCFKVFTLLSFLRGNIESFGLKRQDCI